MAASETIGTCSPENRCSLPTDSSAALMSQPMPESGSSAALKLDIVSDTICPWCYVGKRKIADALEILGRDGLTFDVTWRPCQLNPDMPKDGLDRRQYRSAKFGSWERSQALDAQVTAAGQTVGLAFRHDLMTRTPNTLASHALIRLARETGGTAMQDTIVEALFAAYFTEGRDVGDHTVLADLGASAGLDRGLVLAALSDPARKEAVGYEENLARGLGLNGVPSVLLEGHYLFSGAQPVPAIVEALREAAAALWRRTLVQLPSLRMSMPDVATSSGDRPLKIAVAGGSIGGLCAGLALNGAGFDVQVYERDPGPMNTRGAGIVVQGELTQLLRAHGAPPLPTTSCSVRRYLDPDGGNGQTQSMPQAFTSWEAIYTTLRSAFPAARYHMGAALSGVEDREGGVAVDIDGVGRLVADLLVCADGAQSASRRRLLPDVTLSYAGYVAWRGTLDEADAPAELVRFFDDAFTFCEARTGGHILNYLIPGDGAAVTIGRRRLNWVWYVMANEADLATLLVDHDGRRHHASLPQGGASDNAVRDLRDLARREVHPMLAALVAATPDPFIQTIVDVVVPQTVFGRVCLLGDAAFLVRPHTAGAAAKAARDATVLAAALKRAQRNVDAGLSSFEDMQLEYGRDLTNYGVALGNRWAAKAR